jgi:phosphomannomutase
VHRHDTGTLSSRQVRRLAETEPRGRARPLFEQEWAGGVYLNDLTAPTARRLAAAFGAVLRGAPAQAAEPPTVAVAGDGRALSSPVFAAVAEGLRWAACHVVDVGAASAACLAFAISHLGTRGGILVGNPAGEQQSVGLKFFDGDGGPLSAGGGLDGLAHVFQAGVDRPARTCGSLRRFTAETPYLAHLAPQYHALRPLRLVLDAGCAPVAAYLRKLIEPVACRVIPGGAARADLAEQVRAHEAHFAASIGDDGETCRVLDERGREVPEERLLVLVARHVRGENAPGPMVLEQGTSRTACEAVEALGCRVVLSGVRRSEMASAMRQHGALFGGGPSGRFWYADAGPPLADGLRTLTRLITLLSRSDRRLSEVLDHEAVLR